MKILPLKDYDFGATRWVSGTVFKSDGGHQARFGLIANNAILQ